MLDDNHTIGDEVTQYIRAAMLHIDYVVSGAARPDEIAACLIKAAMLLLVARRSLR